MLYDELTNERAPVVLRVEKSGFYECLDNQIYMDS